MSRATLPLKERRRLQLEALARGRITMQSRRTDLHGYAGTRTYVSWSEMKKRCRNKKVMAYPRYGGRGITVCSRWLDFRNFLKDMGECPEGLELERIDTNGNYEPGNCRWATIIEQANNRRSNVFIEYRGQVKTIAQWARHFGMRDVRLRKRLNRGWTFEEAINGKS